VRLRWSKARHSYSNVIELGRHEDDLSGVKIAVLAPVAGLTRTQLRSMVPLARDAGCSVSWHEPRLGGLSVARGVRALAGELAGIRGWSWATRTQVSSGDYWWSRGFPR
jgi:hypothetical protein